MLKRHEGYRNKKYKCPAGKNTIGVGHNFDSSPLPLATQAHLNQYGAITDEMIDQLLDADILIATKDCKKLYPGFDSFSEKRQAALIDFLFNVGIGTASDFKQTNRYINAGLWDNAAANMKQSKWYRQVGFRGVEIVKMIKEG